MGNLTAEQVRRLDTPGRYTDGGGLCLVVTPGGTKQWVSEGSEGWQADRQGVGRVSHLGVKGGEGDCGGHQDGGP